MISWATPWALFLLIPVGLLVFRRRWVGVHTLSVARLDTIESSVSIRRLLAWVPGWLEVIGLGLLVLALARPQTTKTDTVVDSEGLDIILAIDTSGSMRESDLRYGGVTSDRLAVSKAVVEEFIAGRPHDRIGVVTFGEQAFTLAPLTLDHGTLTQLLTGVQIGIAGAQGTAIGTALSVSAKRLKDLDAPDKVIILLTDGRNNAGRVAPIEAAEASAALGIRIYTVGVGDRGRGLRHLLMPGEGIDEQGLSAIADMTGGKFFHATSGATLRDIYQTIDELEPSPAEVRQLVDRQEQYRMFAVPGLCLLTLQLLLSGTWMRRGP